jgi:hypothetical protein
VRAEGLSDRNISVIPKGHRTYDLLACSAVPKLRFVCLNIYVNFASLRGKHRLAVLDFETDDQIA